MSIDRIINMIIRMVMTRGINFGIKKGMSAMARRPKEEEKPLSPEAKKAQQKTQKNLRHIMRMGRRF